MSRGERLIMKMNNKKFKISGQVFSLALLTLFLTGCTSWFGKKKTDDAQNQSSSVETTSSGKVVASGPKVIEFSDGTSLTMPEIDAEIANVLSANPYTRAMNISQLTPDMKELFFNDMKNRRMVEMWAKDNKIGESEAFKIDLKKTYDLLVQAKYGEWFSNQVKSKAGRNISDREIEKTYEKNKRRYVKSTGGVKTSAVKFESHDDAKAFYESLNIAVISNLQDFEAASKSAVGGQFKDFGRISEDSPRGALSVIVDEAMSRKSFPSIEMVKASDVEYWVCFFEDSKDAVYFEFNEVKNQIRDMLENEKFNEMLESEIKALESKYVKSVDSSVFKAAGDMSGMSQAAAMMPEEEEAMDAEAAN